MKAGKAMRRMLALALAALMLLSGAAVSLADSLPEAGQEMIFGKTEASMRAQTYPYLKYLDKDAGPERSEFTLYYVEDGDIPYVELSEYMPFFSDLLEKAGGAPGLTWEVSKVLEHTYQVKRSDVDSLLFVDTEENTLDFSSLHAFTKSADVSASVTLLDLPEPEEIDMTGLLQLLQAAATGEEPPQDVTKELTDRDKPAEEALFALAAESTNRSDNWLSLNLSEYLIDVVEQDGRCFIPLQTMNDLFLGKLYIWCVFNGDSLYVMPYQTVPNEIYAVPAREMSQEFAIFNYNELRFLLDCQYGLKPEHGISNFGTMLAFNTQLSGDLVSTDPKTFDRALSRLIMIHLDDLHSVYLNNSWMSGTKAPGLDNTSYGYSFSHTSTLDDLFQGARKAAFPDGVPMYQEIGDTAFVTFDTFVFEPAPENYYHLEDQDLDPENFVIHHPEEDPTADLLALLSDSSDTDAAEQPEQQKKEVDTGKLLLYAYRQITRENSPIKNVVLDLSCNGGGDSSAALFTLAWALGQADISLRDTFTGAQTLMHFKADLDLDNTYSSQLNGLVPRGIRVWCLTSGCSFSCGNLVPAALKMSEMVPIVGQTSGGGSCVVLPCSTASGALFQISGSTQLSTVRNGSFYNIDQGIEPDIPLINVASFYDRPALVDYLKNLK